MIQLLRRSVLTLLALAAVSGSGSPARAEGERELARGYKDLADEVGHLAKGLENSIIRDDVKTAAHLYRLEMKSADLVLRNSQVKFKSHQKQGALASKLRAMHGDILILQERMLDHTLDALDKALPGEPTRDLWARVGIDLYRPLFRTGTPAPGAPRQSNNDVLEIMKDEFVAEGGAFDQIKWLGPKYIENATSGELIEWVQVGERIRLTAAGAKHPVIADSASSDGSENGTSVRGAGSMKIYKDADGKVLMAVVSNSSGNYKPGIGSAFGMTKKLEEIGIPRDRIMVTRVLPGEPVLYKLLLKSKKNFTKEQINTRVSQLKSRVRGLRIATPMPGHDAADATRGLASPRATAQAAAPRARRNTAAARRQRAADRRSVHRLTRAMVRHKVKARR